MAGWTDLPGLIAAERTQLIEEGIEPAAADRAAAEAMRRAERGADERDVWAAFADLPPRADFQFDEPSDLAGIRSRRNGASRRWSLDLDEQALLDKLHGAWLGRCVGCALGKPVEGFMSARDGVASWQRQKEYLSAISPEEWPLRDYFPARSPAEERVGRTSCPASTREQIAFMESDDDIRYTVLGQLILRRFGPGFCSTHVAQTWMDQLPYRYVCTAEMQAYRNLVIACDHLRPELDAAAAAEWDRKTDWRWITHHLNPYREWIGAQIRVDSYGYAAAGDPELAAELAWRDARISHVKNGIYGAMFCAAMIAAAFATDDPLEIVEAGLAEIPATSRLHAEMRQVIDLCARWDNDFTHFESMLADLYALLGHYHPVHTNNNAGLCAAAVLMSGGDFHKGITLAVMGGWDTDCNGATVGSIVGAIAGARRAPSHWTSRLNDTLNSLIINYHPIAISQCARQSLETVRAAQAMRGKGA